MNFSIFDQNGKLIGANGQLLGPQSPVIDSMQKQPKLIAVGATSISIDQNDGAILNTVLVQIKWTLCKDDAAPACEPGAERASTFLRVAKQQTVPSLMKQQ